MKTLKLGSSLAAILVMAACARAQRVEVGQVAPDFSLRSTVGVEHALRDYRGRFVVLEWTNFDCPFVRKHYESQNMQSLQKEFSARGVVWLTICSSAPGKQGHLSVEEWNTRLKNWQAEPTAVLLDPDGKVGRLFDARTTPHMFVINPDGLVIYAGAIDDRPSADPRDVAGAQNYVRDALNQALAGQEVKVSSTKPYGCSVKY